MKLGVTGTSGLVTPAQGQALHQLITRVAATELHHGDCVGADKMCHDIVAGAQHRDLERRLSLPPMRIIIHPPDNDAKRAFCQSYDEIREPLPYLVRNRNIAAESDLVIAAPRSAEEEIRSGTWATVRYARDLEKVVIIINPDGSWHLDGKAA